MSCPLCKESAADTLIRGVRDFEYLSPGEFAWVRCVQCSLVRIEPIPDGEQLALAYPPNYHSYQEPDSFVTRKLISLALRLQCADLVKTLPAHGRVLEVGCSTGVLLDALSRLGDYDLHGIEYDEASAAIAVAKGLQVSKGSIEEVAIKENFFDLVVMHHVLEHVSDPALTLAKCFIAMRENGRFVGELPNYASWDAALFGRYWGGGHAPRHLWHFTPATLHAALSAAGFVDIKISGSPHTGHWACSVQNFLRRDRDDDAGLRNGRTWYYPVFLLALIPVNLVQMLFGKTGVMKFECRKQ